MFGEKCLYIHPNISCKFGYYCTRLGCAYSHPVGVNPGMGMMPQMGMQWGGGPGGKFRNLKLDNTKPKGKIKLGFLKIF
jgi:zinc finger CCCH domain-containing protein 14